MDAWRRDMETLAKAELTPAQRAALERMEFRYDTAQATLNSLMLQQGDWEATLDGYRNAMLATDARTR